MKMAELLRLNFPYVAGFFFLIAFAAKESNASSGGNDNSTDDNSKCGIYLAPSSIPNAGLGMYAGHRDFDEGQMVTDGDIIIPIFEMDWHNKLKESTQKYEHFLWDEYTWNGDVFPGAEEETEDIDWLQFASPGVGAAANSYLSLVNIDDAWIELGLATDPKSPGAGAQTPYHGRYFTATEDIPAGGELWVSYGSNYFKSRPHVYGYIPMPENYPIADALLKRFERMRLRNELGPKEELPKEFWEDLLQTVRDYSPIWKKSRVLNALPDTASIIPDLLIDGGTAIRDYNSSIREVSWLEENGQCMDNIKVSKSQESPDAGRGAFANRFIPRDGLVAPAPVVHVPDYDVLKMYLPVDTPLNPDGGFKVIPDMKGPFHYQLILNYCFGHEESTLLLCPYGLLTALINHSSKNANTKLIWSDTMRHKEWLEKPIDHFGEEYIAGLQIDFVALRDIQEDEEILIDYGASWEQAWEEHVKKHVPRENYIPAFELNKKLSDLEFRTVDDRPYALEGVQLRCHAWYVNQFLREDSKEEEEDVPCAIFKKLGDDRYRVQVVKDESDNFDSRFSLDRMLWELPSDAFFFSDLPYEREHHFNFDAFRHAMMIPDDVFPDAWKNLVKK